MRIKMTGWKTKLGAVLLALSPVLHLFGLGEFEGLAQAGGAALTAAGIGHKIEKAGRL